MGSLIGLSLGIVSELLKLINTEVSRKYIDRFDQIQRDILEEEERRDLADDAKLEHLYKEAKIALEGLKNEQALHPAQPAS